MRTLSSFLTHPEMPLKLKVSFSFLGSRFHVAFDKYSTDLTVHVYDLLGKYGIPLEPGTEKSNVDKGWP